MSTTKQGKATAKVEKVVIMNNNERIERMEFLSNEIERLGELHTRALNLKAYDVYFEIGEKISKYVKEFETLTSRY